jgi:hypothetical protein
VPGDGARRLRRHREILGAITRKGHKERRERRDLTANEPAFAKALPPSRCYGATGRPGRRESPTSARPAVGRREGETESLSRHSLGVGGSPRALIPGRRGFNHGCHGYHGWEIKTHGKAQDHEGAGSMGNRHSTEDNEGNEVWIKEQTGANGDNGEKEGI